MTGSAPAPGPTFLSGYGPRSIGWNLKIGSWYAIAGLAVYGLIFAGVGRLTGQSGPLSAHQIVVLALGGAVVTATLYGRCLAIKVVAEGDSLVVRNVFRTYRVSQDEIEWVRPRRIFAGSYCAQVGVRIEGRLRTVTLLAVPWNE